MKITIISDCHWNGPTPMNTKPEFGPHVFCIGDNHEFINVLESSANALLGFYKQFIDECKRTGTHVLAGNHEGSAGIEVRYILEVINGKRVLFLHGDVPFYKKKKRLKWWSKPIGVSKFKLFFIKLKNKFIHGMGTSKISNSKIKKLNVEMDFHDADVVVIGHTHPRELIDITIGNRRYINVMQGKTIIDI